MPPNMDRKKVLWKVRSHALQILSARHPAEFAQIKADLLERWGHGPIENDIASRTARSKARRLSHDETVD